MSGGPRPLNFDAPPKSTWDEPAPPPYKDWVDGETRMVCYRVGPESLTGGGPLTALSLEAARKDATNRAGRAPFEEIFLKSKVPTISSRAFFRVPRSSK